MNLISFRTLAAMISLSALTFSTASNAARDEILVAGTYDCVAQSAQTTSIAPTWTIEYDERMHLAVVNDEDQPADYSPTHIRIRLEPNGPTLTIGRVTGRVLALSDSGETIALGRCTPRTNA